MWVLDHKDSWTLKKWCFWILWCWRWLESPLDSKEIKPVNHKWNQPWIFIRRTDAEAEAPILWPPDARSRLTGKHPDAGKDWGQEEKGAIEDERVGWYHWLDHLSLSKLQEIVKFKTKVLTGLVSPDASVIVLQVTIFLLGLPLCTYIPVGPSSFSYKYTSHTG